MAEKDIVEKTLEGFNDVFADIVNVLLFDGDEVIKPDELSDVTPNSYYKLSGKTRSQERDVAKMWNNGEIRISMIGLENQTQPDKDMPIRVIGYDGAAYRDQLKAGEHGNICPVITIVLYFGYQKRWTEPRTLLERIEVPEKLKPYVSDYKINIFEIAYLDDDTVSKFNSDFKEIVDYFTQMRKSGEFIPDKNGKKLTHA